MQANRINDRIGLRRALLCALAAATLLGGGGLAGLAEDAQAGASDQVRFIRNADSSLDETLRNAGRSHRKWIRNHYFRMVGFAPFFTRNALRWAPPTWLYKDAYAVYNDRKRVPGRPDRTHLDKHPNWVLRDGGGRRLFIPFGCGGGTCPAFAGDLFRPTFRTFWKRQAHHHVSRGYAGLYIDDVNMEFRVGTASDKFVPPIDARTGEEMTLGTWRNRMMAFMRGIDKSFSSKEIVHNILWFAGTGSRMARQVRAANFAQLERGFSDRGIVGGRGKFGYVTFLNFIRWVHRQGTSVVLRPRNIDRAGAIYELANYFLIKGRRDSIVSSWRADRADWWRGWETNLGRPKGARYRWGVLFRRNYGRGIVVVNQPDAKPRTFTLPRPYTSLTGNRSRTFTLGPGRGIVLFRR